MISFFFAASACGMLLRFALLVGGTHKARVIAILLLLHFGLAALNHYIEIGEIESDRQSLEAQFPELGVACYDYIPWLIALSATVLFAFGETFGVGFLWYLPEVVRHPKHPRSRPRRRLGFEMARYSPRPLHYGDGGGPLRGRARLDHFRGARLAQGVGRTTRRQLPDLGGHRDGPRIGSAAAQPRLLQMLSLSRRRSDNRRASRPTR